MIDIPSKQTACDTCVKLHIKCTHMSTPSAASGESGKQAKASAKPASGGASGASGKQAKAVAKAAPSGKWAKSPAAAKPAPVAAPRASGKQTKTTAKSAPVVNKEAALTEEEVAMGFWASTDEDEEADVDFRVSEEKELFVTFVTEVSLYSREAEPQI